MEVRDESGRFAAKSATERKVRSIRATDHVWDDFGFEAYKRRITRADLLELWIKEPPTATEQDDLDLDQVADILEQALALKANSGGAIKAKIREVLELLKPETRLLL